MDSPDRWWINMTLTKLKLMLFAGILSTGFGSDYSFKIQYGMTSYPDIGSMEAFQDMVEGGYADLGIPVKSVQSFPAVPELGFQMIRNFPGLSVGIFMNNSASGGRFHYSDYSGSITFNYVLSNQRYGVILSTPEFKLGGLNFTQTMQLGRMPTTFKFDEVLEVWDITQTDRETVETLAYFIEPGLGVEFFTRNKLSVGAYLGAAITLTAKPYHLPGHDNATLRFENGDKFKADWKEVKLALSFSYSEN